MVIKVKPYELQSKAAYAASIASQLNALADQVNGIYYRLDSEVRHRRGIGSSIRSLESRIDRAQQKMYNISSFLSKAAERYNAAEAGVAARAASLGSAASLNAGVGAVGVVSAGAYTGAAQSNVEGKKWYQSNWFKLAVGAAVVGAAVAVAVLASPAVAAIATAAAVGAGIGGVIGGITGGAVSKMNGGSFWDGAADGFMWGAIGGAASGAIGATGVGIMGAAAGEGAVNAGVYAGQTLQNGSDVTVGGFLTSFVVGAGFSAIGTVVSNKISGIISRNVSGNVDEAVEVAGNSKLTFNSKSEYFDYINDVGKRSDLSIQDKIEKIKEVYNVLGDKTDVNCPIDAKYVKGFDDSGRVIYDWPDKMGFDHNSITSITKESLLPDNWDRYGSMGGDNFASIPENGVKYTYDQRSIPYVENPQAYHSGMFNNDSYFDIIDAIKDNDLDKMNVIRKEKGLAEMDIDDFEYYKIQYNNYLEKVKIEIGDIDATYGLRGNAAMWEYGGEIVMQGGAEQIITPFNGNILKKLGILNKLQ